MAQQDQTDRTIEELMRWSQSRDDVCAVLITSTRAVPGARLDAYSDYDVIVVVDDVDPFADNNEWLSVFGDVLIAYWDPLNVDPYTGAVSVGNVTQYVNGLKIDFGVWSVQRLHDVVHATTPMDELDAGYRILLDKRGLTSGLPAPTYAAYTPPRPDEETYLRLITDFFIGPPYVAKSLLRGQLLPAKWVLDFDMRYNYLVPMLEWRVECDHDWAWKPGSLGKGLEAQVQPEVWTEFEATFVGHDESANWDALFAMMTLFGQIAREVAALLCFRYPQDLDDRVVLHVHRMRDGDFATGPLPDA